MNVIVVNNSFHLLTDKEMSWLEKMVKQRLTNIPIVAATATKEEL